MNSGASVPLNILCLAAGIATFLALEFVLIEHPPGLSFTHDGGSAYVRPAGCLLRE